MNSHRPSLPTKFAVGQELPPLSVVMTAKRIIMGAAASRDWQPQHHDYRYSVEQARLRDIILNTPTQTGWLSHYITDWSGPEGRMARLRLRMKIPICPGDVMQIRGIVEAVESAPAGWWWARLRLEIRVAEQVNSEGSAIVGLPGEGRVRPWQARGKEWCPPDWDLRSSSPRLPATGSAGQLGLGYEQ
jgi:acyl dehydratase